MGTNNMLFAVILLPFAGFLFNLLAGSFVGKKLVSLVGCGVVIISFILSAQIFMSSFLQGASTAVQSNSIRWIDVLDFNVDITLYVDHLTIVMMLVVTGVGSLIHIYSVGYMHDDKRFNRYFSYINLFTSFMLLLIMGKSLLLMFVGWEGVGLCSYLLIGFWFDDKEKGISNSLAGMKAFIVNRVGDLSFTIGLMILFTYLGEKFNVWTLDILKIKDVVATNETALNIPLLTAVCILLFGGACGKSAQIPLYVWLPDAMAGPTPVSALIHAATMVTAGVYMVARFNFIFALCPTALAVVALVGATTALFAATIGMTQFDIKKVLAYSTVSQLGYMFLACGVGAFIAAIFHLVTHAFFKACLFLGSGSVIHGTGGEQDIRHMGGLRKKMPITFITFAIATIAIAGIPPLAGFFSKDEILWKAFSSNLAVGKLVWIIGLITAFITAFYMFRLLFLTFFGDYRGHHHVHESPFTMVFALIVLATLSVIGGWVGIPDALGEKVIHTQTNKFEHFLDKSIPHEAKSGPLHKENSHEHHSSAEFILMGVSILVALSGIFLAYYLYMKKKEIPAKIASSFPELYNTIYNKYFVDEAYSSAIVQPLIASSVQTCRFDNTAVDGSVNTIAYSTGNSSKYVGVFDNNAVDAAVNGVANEVYSTGGQLRLLQSGNIKMYLSIAVVSSILIMAVLWSILEWKQVKDFLVSLGLL